jgi:hypothetical protein
MRRPRRLLIRHAEANECQIPAWLVEGFPAPAFNEIRYTELTIELQAASGQCVKLFLDGHATPRNSTERLS